MPSLTTLTSEMSSPDPGDGDRDTRTPEQRAYWEEKERKAKSYRDCHGGRSPIENAALTGLGYGLLGIAKAVHWLIGPKKS